MGHSQRLVRSKKRPEIGKTKKDTAKTPTRETRRINLIDDFGNFSILKTLTTMHRLKIKSHGKLVTNKNGFL